MNSDVFIRKFSQTLQEFGKALVELKRQDDERNSCRSTSEDDYEHDYGYELNYHNPSDSHKFPHPCNKKFPTTLHKLVSKHQTQPRTWVNNSQSSIRHPNQVTRSFGK